MAFARVSSIQPGFPVAPVVSIEADLSRGLFSYTIVGLPGKSVEEARDRVNSAIKHAGFDAPKSKNHKVVISLAPADLKKEGPVFDLGIAIAYLAAADIIPLPNEKIAFIGELGLDGTLRKVRGALAAALGARTAGFSSIIVPRENAPEAALVPTINVYGASSLADVVAHITGRALIPLEPHITPTNATVACAVDVADIAGQEHAKRAMEIAAAGRHNIALMGPPGTGKTMLAAALAGILPPLSPEEIIEVTAIHSVAGALTEPYLSAPPFRAPHHTASYVALTGGGTTLKPGEVTLAHRGVLFLDEFPEFDRRAIEALREPLENRCITVARSAGSATFPANIMLVAAMNPPRDYADQREAARFQKKLSAAIADRIDLWVDVPLVPHEKLSEHTGENSATLRARVIAARERARARSGGANSEIKSRDIERVSAMSGAALAALQKAAAALKLSPRSYHRSVRTARTIADLAGSDTVEAEHMLEALQYRPKMREG